VSADQIASPSTVTLGQVMAERNVFLLYTGELDDGHWDILLRVELRKRLYRVIQEELPPLTELISDDILSKKCHINLGPIHNIYRVNVRIWKRTTVKCAWPSLT
jgi:hypothetical protein